MSDQFFDQSSDFKRRQQRIARRRQAALEQVQRATQVVPSSRGEMVGPVRTVGNQLGTIVQNIAAPFLANRANEQADSEEATLAQELADIQNRLLSTVPQETREATLPADQAGPVGTYDNPNYDRDVQDWSIKASMTPGMEKAAGIVGASAGRKADRDFRQATLRETLEARAAEAEANRQWRAQDREDAQKARLELRATPSQHISIRTDGNGTSRGKPPVGYRWTETGDLSPITGGPADKPSRPLPERIAKGAHELVADAGTMDRLLTDFQDDYAGGLGAVTRREAGKVLGGMAPESTQQATRWWSDQAMFDELPQRHALFGAALTPTEQKSWRDAAISPNLDPKVIRQRLATRKALYETGIARMRSEAEGGGFNTQQFDAIVKQQGGTPTERKTVGGKNYVKQNGKWFEE